VGGFAQDITVFTIDSSANTVLPYVDVSNFWLFFYEGNFLGFFQAFLITTFFNLQAAIALIIMLFLVPIYLRTKSLLLICILWIMLGGFFIAAMPLASGIAIIFIVLGVGGLVFRLFRSSSYG
jgi:fatty acid desaturase